MDTTLNPEAAEFFPAAALASIQKGFVTMNKTVRISNNLPLGMAYKEFKSVPDFKVVSSQLSHNVLLQLNSIFLTELPTFKLKEDDLEYITEKLIDANDSILDRIYSNIEYVSKGVTSGDQVPYDNKTKRGVGSGYYTPVITKIKLGSTTFTGAKNIMRPQLLFQEPIDNTNSLWIPKITDKPNNIKPLALEVIYNELNEVVGYEHPYYIELSLFKPRPEWLLPDSEEPTFPPTLSDTKLTYVSTEEQLNLMLDHLQTVDEIAVDLEHHSYRSYQGFTCLIQLTTSGGDYIVDAIELRSHLHKLNDTFTNPKILKVFHGADMDVLWLQRDFGVYVVGMFDTYAAAVALKHPRKSLAALLKLYCGVYTDKTFQLADWRLRPLLDDMITYARMDTHYLLYIQRRMKADLLNAANGQTDLLLAVFDKSTAVCRKVYTKPQLQPSSHLSAYCGFNKSFSSRQMAALKMLYGWRDEHARQLDESTTYLLPNHMLLSLAELLPREVQGVSAVCQPMPPFVKQNLVAIHRMLLTCRELTVTESNDMSGYGAASVELPPPEYDVHDLADDDGDANDHPESATHEHSSIPLDKLPDIDENEPTVFPDIRIFAEDSYGDLDISKPVKILPMFFPPYWRYQKYRLLIQRETTKTVYNEIPSTSNTQPSEPLTVKDKTPYVSLNTHKSHTEHKKATH